jgi:hypothetical protein
MSWNRDDRAEPLLTPLGSVLQEASFRLGGSWPIASRLSALLGALVAASLLLFWLRARGVRPLPALALAGTYLLDPLVAQSYKGGRVDCLAMAFMFLAALLGRRHSRTMDLLAGAFVALGMLTWPSAFLLLPLVMVEILSGGGGRERPFARSRATSVATFAGAASLAGLVLLALFLYAQRHFAESMADILRSMYSSHAGKGVQHASTLQGVAGATVDTVRMSPLIWIASLFCLLLRPSRPLVITSLAAWIVVLLTVVYPFRVVYLAPYAILIMATCSVQIPASRLARVGQRLSIALPLLFSIVATLVLRPMVAIAERQERNPEIVLQLGQQHIGEGPHSVYVDCWEFYFPGRALGWHMYNAYGLDKQHIRQILARADFAVLSPEGARAAAFALADSGLRPYAEFHTSSSVDSRPRFFGHIGSHPYGPYVFYKRP